VLRNFVKNIPYLNSATRSIYCWFVASYRTQKQVEQFRDLMHSHIYEIQKVQAKNPINKQGVKCYSQSDEDGLTIEILRRIGQLNDPGTFLELGVGTGDENNTLILLVLGWRGVWIGNEGLKFDHKINPSKLCYLKEWITLKNIHRLSLEGLSKINAKEYDVVSLDLDGNDFYLVENILKNGVLPKLFIVEYNGKFPPPIRFKVPNDEDRVYSGDDFYGASLMAYVDLFLQFKYKLVCCNLMTGANAFFVRDDFKNAFTDVPEKIEDIYVTPRYLLPNKFGHTSSLRAIEVVLTSSHEG
jgi:hypothetical protein